MELRETFPFWDQLSAAQQALITQRAVLREVPAGAVLSGAGTDCVGLLVLRSGRLRAYVLSQDGREVTLYRLTAGEICLFSASCVLGTAQMDLTVEAEQDSTVWVIPPDVFRQIARVGSGGRLCQYAHGPAVFRGDVAGGAGDVAEHGPPPGRLFAGGERAAASG